MPNICLNVFQDQLVDSTNKLDLYRAIFLSSSDEEDDDDKNPGSSNQTQRREQPTAKDLNILRNNSPPRGIFANLDLDKLNSIGSDRIQKPPDEISNKDNFTETLMIPPRGIFAGLNMDNTNNQHRKNHSNKIGLLDKVTKDNSASSIESTEPVQENSDMYGPTLPKNIPQPQQRIENVKEESSSNEDDWVEMYSASGSETSHKLSTKKKHSKKSHRKSKRHKEKKHKHKKKTK